MSARIAPWGDDQHDVEPPGRHGIPLGARYRHPPILRPGGGRGIRADY